MPPSDSAVDLYKRRLQTYRDRTSASLVLAWDDLDNYSDAGLEQFTETTAPLLAGAKAATVATAAAFLSLVLKTRTVSIKADDVDIDPKIRDPFLAAWHALKMGRPLDEAVTAGRSQAQALGWDFVESTARRTGDHVAKAAGRTVRWRRVPSGGACGFCRTAAGQTYHMAATADFGHHRCGCAVVPA